VYKFAYYDAVFYIHHLMDIKGQLCVGTWQISHNGVPVTFIKTPSIDTAYTMFLDMANTMGEERFNARLEEVVSENRTRLKESGVLA
jgi:hypothetical protein